MHASHSVLYNGKPSRWAGNRVFPNGFIEMELKRGRELVIYGAQEVTDKFTLSCDSQKITAVFDENGCFTMPLPESDEPVKIRLEKSGEKYPVFYSVATRSLKN